MAEKLNITVRNYVFEKLKKSKPERYNFSEWVEELIMKGYESQDKHDNLPPFHSVGIQATSFFDGLKSPYFALN